ncbi:MAG: methicillin resistance protein [Sediminibacterium sp.]|nr:MAG: methicillin resistance protein [Sediminibacterium sp.] [Sediminibacterium sp. FEMGT703S]
MNQPKEKYLGFCQNEDKIPIFSMPWWLDAVCGENNWDVILIENGNEIVASFPFYFHTESRLKFKQIEMPALTQKLGPFIKYPEKQSYSSKLSYEKAIMQQIIQCLPNYDFLAINFDYKYTNWLPFYWNGFQQTTRYTYIVEDLSNDEIVFNSFAGNKKTDIRKATKNVLVKYDLECEDFITFYVNALKKKNENLAYSPSILRKLITKAYFYNKGRIIYSVGKDNPNDIYGAIFYVWDNDSIYSLVTAFDVTHGNVASSSLLFYQIMKDFKNSGLKFDFEGSMIEQIERSYNKFGTIQVPYFRISKINSLKYKIFSLLSELRNEFRN